MKVPNGSLLGLTSSQGIVGPWPCSECGELSQYADVQRYMNTIFCKNESCRYRRTIDKRRNRIVENDGSVWWFDNYGNKGLLQAAPHGSKANQ